MLRFTFRGKTKEMGLGSAASVPLADAREKAASARRKIAHGLNPIDERKRDGIIPTFGEMADDVRETLAAGFRNEKHKAQWKSTLETYAAPLRAKPVDTIATDDVLSVLKPIWTTKAETASRVRGRIEKVLDAAKAKGFRSGENPARWRGHLDHLLPRPSKLSRGHHAAMPYEEVANFIAKLRTREATAALALELCILTAARSGEILGMRWSEIDFDNRVWIVPANRMKAGREHRVPLPLEARRAVISGLVPRTLFLMPTVSIITSTTGWFLAKRMGFLDVGYPGFHWVIAALVIVTILTIQGTGILLPTNLRLYFELQKPNPDSAKIGRWMRWFVGWWRSRARCKSRYSLSWQSSRPGSSALPHLDEIFLEEIVPKLRQVQCAKVERHPRASARICQFVGLHFRSAHRPETQ